MHLAARIAADRGPRVDSLNKWFGEFAATPLGSLLLFVLVFITRVTIDQWSRRRDEKKKKRRKAASHG